MNKTFILTIALLAAAFNISAQSTAVSFSYDSNGNRISSSLVVIRVTDNEVGYESVENPCNLPEDMEMSIYPNPTCSSLTISADISNQNENIHASLSTFNGVLIEEKAITAPKTELDLTGHPAGVYFLTVTIGNEKRFWKIIKTQ